MLVRCHSASGSLLPEMSRVMGETDETVFSPLRVDEHYNVYGMMFYSSRVDFLVCPEPGGPMWAPSELFDVIDNIIPQGWGILFTKEHEGYSDLLMDFGIHSICGYQRLIESYSHYTGIIERNFSDMEYFYSLYGQRPCGD